MAFCMESVIRRIPSSTIRKLSTAAEAVRLPEESLYIFRTNESNPVNHTKDHLKRFYTVPHDERQRIFYKGSLPKRFEIDTKTFNECCIMVRQPALEIMSYLRQSDYTKPVNKYVIYGDRGCGKTTSLLHLIHYGYNTKHVLIHVPWIQSWYEFPKEYSDSPTRPGLMDLPIESATWLAHFRVQNIGLLSQLDIRTSKDYVWNSRENTPKGASILEMIEFGISRIKFASEVIFSLIQELKQTCIADKCKVMVIIDGCNALFSNHTRIKNDNKRFLSAKEVTITHAFLEIIKSDWNHGAVILSVDRDAAKETRDSIYPRYLLQNEGFEYLDPFIPVPVTSFDDVEFDMMMEYYKDRKWVRDITPNGQRELQLLTNGNPRRLAELCAGL